MDSDSSFHIVTLVLLILLSAFFSASETALTTLNQIRLRSLIEEGNKKAEKVLAVLENRSKMLSTILILNNLVNLYASSLTTAFAMQLWGNKAIAAATGILTMCILVFGEIIPKTLASIYNEGFALTFIDIIQFFITILTPVVFLIDGLSFILLKPFGVDKNKVQSSLTENELRTMVDVSREEGVIENEEHEMINNVFDFGDSVAKDVMIPRVEMTCVNAEASFSELEEVFSEKKYTRMPVFEESTDNIIGIINMKDILFIRDTEDFHIKDYMREASFTYEYKKTSELMIEMRQSSVSMVCVLDEYGATVGLITLEDLIEEIVGDIKDEFDEDEDELIQEVGDRTYLLDGSLKLDDINDVLGTDFESENYDSIGGLLIEQLEKLPEGGEIVTMENGAVLETVEMDKNHIERVKLTLPEPEDKDTEEQAAQEQEAE
ncbi:MAG: HlyC/CorC family transporter [Lachnospiraceae bacterium]|nr:HlyC/CorC family transporter [Lachnospiraceae bacterium]